MDRERLKAAVERARHDLLYFGRLVAPHLFTVKASPMHQELAELALDRKLKRVNIIAPRGCAKTTIIGTLLPLHYLTYPHGKENVLIISKTEDAAKGILESIKSLLESDRYRAIYGVIGGQDVSEVWAMKRITTRNGGHVTVRGMNQQIRGIQYKNKRPTLIVLDDPEDEENTKTPESREANYRKLNASIWPARDPQVGRLVVVGTPLHQACIVMRLKGNEQFVTKHYSALVRKEGVPETAPEEGKWYSIWPQQYTVRSLLKDKEQARKDGHLSTWYSEYMCEVVGDDDQLFREEYLRYWDGELKRDANGMPFLEVREMDGEAEDRQVPVTLSMAVDPASSTKRHADYTGIVLLAMDGEQNIYVVDYVRDRLTPIEVANRIKSLYEKYRPDRLIIETHKYQAMLKQYIMEKAPHIPIIGVNPSTRISKEERISGMQPDFAMRKVFLKPSMTELTEELIIFPRGTHDDLVDAMQYARRYLYPPMHNVADGDQPRKRRHRNWMLI